MILTTVVCCRTDQTKIPSAPPETNISESLQRQTTTETTNIHHFTLHHLPSSPLFASRHDQERVPISAISRKGAMHRSLTQAAISCPPLGSISKITPVSSISPACRCHARGVERQSLHLATVAVQHGRHLPWSTFSLSQDVNRMVAADKGQHRSVRGPREWGLALHTDDLQRLGAISQAFGISPVSSAVLQVHRDRRFPLRQDRRYIVCERDSRL